MENRRWRGLTVDRLITPSFIESYICNKTLSLKLLFEGDLRVVLSGAIDLVFKEEGGWVIADYKTDEIVGDLQSYVDYYAPQVRLYRRFWAEITGEHVKESGLFFTSLNRWITL